MTRYFKYVLLATFFAAVFLIVFLQFNSNRSINQLITGNENLLNELGLKNNLQQLQTGIVTLENKVRGTVIEGPKIDSNHLQEEIDDIQTLLTGLKQLENDNAITSSISELGRLVNSKIAFNKTVLDSFSEKGKTVAEKLINTQLGKRMTDSIHAICSKIDDIHQAKVTALIKEADNNGNKARILGTIIAIIAAITSFFTFAYVAYKVRQQQFLIRKLNDSEKKVREAAQVKEKFMSNMSHEIRTPMNAILGFTNLLQRESLNTKAQEYVQTIQKSGDNLLTIVNDILDLSKIEAGMLRIETAPFSIRGLLHSVETMFRSKADEKQLKLTAKVGDDMPDTLEGDAVRLTQILVNLVGNAVKFTNAGNVSILVQNNGINKDMIDTGIVVRDTGIGIEREKLSAVFDRFQQAEDSVTRKYGGTGLGLSIVKDLVALQKGTIDAASEPGKGSVFTLNIPYKIASRQTETRKPTGTSASEEPGFPNIHILVAEDNEINQTLLKNLFSYWNLRYELAQNGKEAIEKLEHGKFDLLLMDIQMPEVDGYTATRHIRNVLHSDIPIIAMTAHAMAGEREKCLSYGMNEYISKPIREEQLYKLIAEFSPIDIKKQIRKTDIVSNGRYEYIDLRYMKEVSMGNTEYEKTVTDLFMKTIPTDLAEIEKAWQNNDIALLKKVAHNMKTSISVMSLNNLLNPYLDVLEYENLTTGLFNDTYSFIKSVCETSVAEASRFYQEL
jgi:signal transduction histidine kinase/CheY-like chemotaxis protein